MKNRDGSSLGIFAVDAAALLGTGLSLLKALAVVFLAFGLGALAAPLHMRLVVVFHWEYVLAIEALAVSPTDASLGETLAILGLASRLGAFTLDLALHLGLLAVQRQQIVDLALSYIGRESTKSDRVQEVQLVRLRVLKGRVIQYLLLLALDG